MSEPTTGTIVLGIIASLIGLIGLALKRKWSKRDRGTGAAVKEIYDREKKYDASGDIDDLLP